MRRLLLRLSWLPVLSLVATACASRSGGPTDDPGGDGSENTGEIAQATTCKAQLDFYPVKGKHNNGYDSTAGDKSQWTCEDAHSNSDFNKTHIGNDIWATEGTPVIATVSGTMRYVENSAYSGNKITIVDKCGWYHFFCHLQKFGPGITPGSANGKHVDAGQVIGYVGKTGTAANGVVHLHYSLYPDDDYDAGIDPYPYLHAVEKNTCGCQPTTEVCNGKDDDCDGQVDEGGVCNDVPKGHLDGVDCTKGITGWAQDPDVPTQAIAAHVYFDGPAGKGHNVPVVADDARDDLCKPLGSCNHAFALPAPLSLFDGKPHDVNVYGIDSAAGPNALLAGSPLKLTCPTITPTGVKRWVPDQAAYTKWGFDAYASQLPLEKTVVDAYPDGDDLPAAPTLVRLGTEPAIYLVDHGFKRHISSPAILAAWNLTKVAVKTETAAVVDALPTGPILRPRPLTAVDSKGRIVLFDDPLPGGVGDPGNGGNGGAGGQGSAGASGNGSAGTGTAQGGQAGEGPSGGKSGASSSKAGAAGTTSGQAGSGGTTTSGKGGAGGKSGGAASGADPDGVGPQVVPGSSESGDCSAGRAGRATPFAPTPLALATFVFALVARARRRSGKLT